MGVDRVKVRKGEVESVRRRATQSRVMFQTMNWAEQSGQSQCRVLDCRGGEIVDLPRIDLLLCDSQG